MVEDYTNAFLVTFGIVIFIALVAIYAAWGLVAAIGCGIAADRLIGKPGRRLD